MMRLGYHASHEQFAPEHLLALACQAERAGFDALMSSDHISPWSRRQGNSGFTWTWLGSALQATQSLAMGSLAIPGGWRYHPVVVAHAFATLARMYPERMKWIAAGSGESMNERLMGAGWPDKQERNQRLLEAVKIIRALWRGEDVTSSGLLKAEGARLWSLPQRPPAIYGAALCEETAALMGEWADGLITVRKDVESLGKILDAFRQNGGLAKPVILQLQLSWDTSREKALLNAHDQWRHIALDMNACANYSTPEEFDRASEHIEPEEVGKRLLVTDDPQEIIEHIREYEALGFAEIYLHNAGRNQEDFIDLCKTAILPAFEECDVAGR